VRRKLTLGAIAMLLLAVFIASRTLGSPPQILRGSNFDAEERGTYSPPTPIPSSPYYPGSCRQR